MRYVGDRRGGWKRAIKIDFVRSIKARSLATQTYHVKKEHHDHEDEPEKQLAEQRKLKKAAQDLKRIDAIEQEVQQVSEGTSVGSTQRQTLRE